ncbi:MAG TPA: HAD family hydrolase [Mycobacteriales bacterium]|jgi:HAD superfamily hydrolase (TIGR01509 family)|nr:HAD family hydrolase [Mycobacteriales bacterium]
MITGVLFDIDGTLVDTNYLHVVAWADAFAHHGHDVTMSAIHGLIGQGSERLVDSAIGRSDDAVADAHADIYGVRLHTLRAFDGAAELLTRCHDEGITVVLATSASRHDADHLRAALDADGAIDHVTTNDDADASKPAPDIVEAALDGSGLAAGDCVFVGDTVWDVEAAKRAGMPCVCVLTGGIGEADLRAAGATAIYPSVRELLADFEGWTSGSG